MTIGRRIRHTVIHLLLLASALTVRAQPDASNGIRLYVLDGGVLEASPASYHLTEDEVAATSLSIAAYVVVHPDGILLFDALAVGDAERIPEGIGAVQKIVRNDGAQRPVVLAPSLSSQLDSIGIGPADVTHLALSHYHWDHTANSSTFAHATWLVRPEERRQMFLDMPGGSARPSTYIALENSPTELVTDEEHDVFGDGTVILKAARGHTPGHQVLYVKLAETGGVVLTGDLYHYPEERSLNRLPVSEHDLDATIAAREELERFLERTDAELWIGHDLLAHQALAKAPEYYD